MEAKSNDGTAFARTAGAMAQWLGERQWLAVLLVRASVGTMFATSGWGKLHRLGEFTAYFRQLGIPAPSVQAPMVASLELLGGSALVLGFGTRAAALTLSGVMVVATVTARLKEAQVRTLGDFLYLNEWLLWLLLVWLVFSGPGRVSVDGALARRFGVAAPVKGSTAPRVATPGG